MDPSYTRLVRFSPYCKIWNGNTFYLLVLYASETAIKNGNKNE